jgi:antitoxin (DNA-binding transcriptional repressor) of toxin-antitoxin stability system
MAAGKSTTSRFNIAEAKARFSELVQKAMLGEEVIIGKGHKPLLKLVPLQPPQRRRKPGSAKGQIWMAPDFDVTLDEFDEFKDLTVVSADSTFRK